MGDPNNLEIDIKQSSYKQSFIFVAVAMSVVNTALLHATLDLPKIAHGLEGELVNILQYAPYVFGPLGGIAITFILRGTLKKPVDVKDGENGEGAKQSK